MIKDIAQSITGNQNFLKLQNNINGSRLNNVDVTNSRQIQSKKIQNYYPFRSVDYQRVNNRTNKSRLSNKKQTHDLAPNSGYLHIRNGTHIANEQKTHEYCRYRTATHRAPIKMSDAYKYQFPFSCYSQITKQNENEYSRYRDSQDSRKKSVDEYQNKNLKPHKICRSLAYDNDHQRFPIPDNRVLWNTIFPDYTPYEYTTEKIQRNPRADLADPLKIEKFNQIDKKIDRRSFTGQYYVDPKTNRPRNPNGRTGMTGRGRLYYWGPNHAGDPVVTRWLRDENGSIVYRRNNARDSLKPVLEFVAILRQDRKQWALPGGMVDPGEHISETVKREFQEEALRDGVDKTCIDQLFSNGVKLFESYVDDPRNTDNAWIETVAVNFHDETGQLTKQLHLNAGDDAEKVVWRSIDRNLELYACHKDILEIVVDRFNAYW
ncbi:unnamed protein product [Adineta steineri]|uniref:Nudix hydrolase domain-containing protein n=2 Tax=Adineta steineri TaxID=433720 RepID=A0A814P7X6_9BILA|nr:unnamed protein product [Adineta steineri]CAF3760623.1 unnamed protein product [Adineta steineri]